MHMATASPEQLPPTDLVVFVVPLRDRAVPHVLHVAQPVLEEIRAVEVGVGVPALAFAHSGKAAVISIRSMVGVGERPEWQSMLCRIQISATEEPHSKRHRAANLVAPLPA